MNPSHDEHLNATSRLKSVLPILEWLQEYRKDWLRPDIVAGLTAAAVVIPKAMAYATIAGLPVQAGLYTVFLPMIIYARLFPIRIGRPNLMVSILAHDRVLTLTCPSGEA
jgi:MFS superfamily sulfate permease-like transporter